MGFRSTHTASGAPSSLSPFYFYACVPVEHHNRAGTWQRRGSSHPRAHVGLCPSALLGLWLEGRRFGDTGELPHHLGWHLWLYRDTAREGERDTWPRAVSLPTSSNPVWQTGELLLLLKQQRGS